MWKHLTRALTLLGGLWVFLTVTPCVSWWAQWLSAGYSEESRPVLVVLAGDASSDTVIGYSTYLRCVYAFWYWQQHHPEELILSGGPGGHPTAALMADFLASLGVPRKQMRLETTSEDTRENLASVSMLLQGHPRPVALLTSDFHMRRAMLLARRNHLTAIPYPIPDIGKRFQVNRWEGPGLSLLLTLETCKLSYEYLAELFRLT